MPTAKNIYIFLVSFEMQIVFFVRMQVKLILLNLYFGSNFFKKNYSTRVIQYPYYDIILPNLQRALQIHLPSVVHQNK